jgi:hypothetical protein
MSGFYPGSPGFNATFLNMRINETGMVLVNYCEVVCSMTLIELLFFLVPVLLSALSWKFISRNMGAWGALLAMIVGFGVWALVWMLLSRKLRNKAAARTGGFSK